MKSKLLCIITAMFIALSPITSVTTLAATTVSKLVFDGSRNYIEVDGKPFLNVGIQNVGTCQLYGDNLGEFVPHLPLSWLENCFEKTAAAGFKSIQVSLNWNDFETTSTPGSYSWAIVDQYVNWANKYDLRIDWVWLGTNICGGSSLTGHQFGWRTAIPPYLQDLKYWTNVGSDSFQPKMTGTDADYLHASECAAVKALFNHLATYDTNHRTILFQCYNEPEQHATWNSEHAAHLNAINNLAYAVKSSNYVVATRVNFYTSTLSGYGDINALQYVDFIGADPYVTNVNTIANISRDTANSKLPGIAENAGNYDNMTSLVATALVNRGTYDVWQLNNYWPGFPTPFYSPSVDFRSWTLGTIPPLNPGAQKLKNLNFAMNKIGRLIATSRTSNMAGFNIESDYPSGNYSSSKTVGNYNITLSCSDGSVGMAINSGNYVYCVSDTASTVTYKTKLQPFEVTIGHNDSNDNWVIDSNKSYTNNGDGTYSITLNSQECVRIQLPTAVLPFTNFFNQAYTGSRNDATGNYGYEFQPAKDITVTALGRCVSGSMSDNHAIRIWNESDQSVAASTTVTPSSPTDANGYKNEMLTTPVTLRAGTKYLITSYETSGGDMWMNWSNTQLSQVTI